MRANMNDRNFYDFLTEYESGHLFYSVDETDEVFDNLKDAQDYGKSISNDWIGEMNVCEYSCNVRYNEDEFKYERIDELDSELAFTGNYWTLTESGWKKDSEKMDINPTAQEIIDNGNYDSAVALMDDEIREAVHADLAPCSDAEFLTEYMKRHAQKYGEEFCV